MSRTHVISAILNIKQKVDSPWPLQIYDNDGKLHEITLEPGEMVWYESARLIHGRVKKLNGTYYENVFVHYMPKYEQNMIKFYYSVSSIPAFDNQYY